MSVTSASAFPKVWVGSFNYTTESLTLPATTLENKLSLALQEIVSTQLADFTGGSYDILLTVDFEGTTIYTNSEYPWSTSVYAPEDPDISVTVLSGPPVVETATINNYVSMVTDSAGALSEGTYTVTADFVYTDSGGEYVSESGTFTADFSFSVTEPTLTEWYDQGVPKLKIQDTQSYIYNGTTPDIDTEFTLYPPQNAALINNTYDNVQSVTYTSYTTGGNEVRYTILLTYTFSDLILVNAQQEYDAFTIYYIDNCAIYNCLKDQYDLWKSSTCGTKVEATAKDTLYEATSIALQITQGLGCNSDELSSLVSDFNALLDCDCECLSDSPTQINQPGTVAATERQAVSASTASTEIDLSAGRVVTITASSDTTLTVTNIEQYTDYRFVLIDDGSGRTITFDSGDFEDSDGSIADVTLDSSGVLVMDFYSYSLSKLTLRSRSDGSGVKSVTGTSQEIDVDNTDAANPILSLATEATASLALADSASQPGDYVSDFVNDANYLSSGDNVSELTNDAGYSINQFQDLGTVTTNQNIDVDSGNNVFLTVTSSDINLVFSNVAEGGVYRLVVRNNGGSTRTLTVSETFVPNIVLNTTEIYGATFLGILISGIPYLIPTGQQTN